MGGCELHLLYDGLSFMLHLYIQIQKCKLPTRSLTRAPLAPHSTSTFYCLDMISLPYHSSQTFVPRPFKDSFIDTPSGPIYKSPTA